MPSGTREDVERITANDVRSFWRTWYRPNNATLIIAGDLTVPEALAKATAAFGSWSRGTLPAIRSVTAPAASPTTITLIDKPRAAQSSFRIGGIGVARNTPDYYALQVMNTALGGSFTSRLNQNLRETKGYTYGASSGFAMRREAGPFTARAEVVAAKTDSALLEFLHELTAIRTPMPAAELAKTKTYLQLSYAERFETSGDLAREIAALVPVGIPLSSLRQYQSRMAAVTRRDVQRVAQRHLNPASLVIVIAGDTTSLAPALRALNVAPVTARDARGRPIITP
jgi:predicted Zn-dependent peptidase